MASDLVNQYYIRSMEHLVGENGALLMKEQDVAKGVDGKSYTDYHTGELDKVEAELLSGASPEVAQYATEKIRTLRRGFVGQLFNHERPGAVELRCDDAQNVHRRSDGWRK